MYDEIPPVYALNDYVWALLQNKLDWKHIRGLVPVVPAAQQPELNDQKKPFIVYGFAAEDSPSDLFVLNVETVAYTVYSESTAEVNTTTSMLSQALRRLDESAADVNHWIKVKSPQKDKFKGINFASIGVTSSQGANAEETEGGRQDGMIIVRYMFTVDLGENEFRL